MNHDAMMAVPSGPDTSDFWRRRPSLAAPRASALGGRGLFAIAPIAERELIDRAVCVDIGASQSEDLDRMRPIGDFYFAHPQVPKAGLMAFGLMSICNHADIANADVTFFQSEDLGWIADLTARRAINSGEEITYSYKCPLWFSARK